MIAGILFVLWAVGLALLLLLTRDLYRMAKEVEANNKEMDKIIKDLEVSNYRARLKTEIAQEMLSMAKELGSECRQKSTNTVH